MASDRDTQIERIARVLRNTNWRSGNSWDAIDQDDVDEAARRFYGAGLRWIERAEPAYDADSMLEGARATRAAMLRDAGALRAALKAAEKVLLAADRLLRGSRIAPTSNQPDDPIALALMDWYGAPHALSLIRAALASDTGGSSTADPFTASWRAAEAAMPAGWSLLMGHDENGEWWATASEPRDPATHSYRIVSSSHDSVLYGSPSEALDVLAGLLAGLGGSSTAGDEP